MTEHVMLFGGGGVIRDGDVYGSEREGYTCELTPDVRVGDVVSSSAGLWQVTDILTQPYEPRRPWTPADLVVRCSVRRLCDAAGWPRISWRDRAESRGEDTPPDDEALRAAAAQQARAEQWDRYVQKTLEGMAAHKDALVTAYRRHRERLPARSDRLYLVECLRSAVWEAMPGSEAAQYLSGSRITAQQVAAILDINELR